MSTDVHGTYAYIPFPLKRRGFFMRLKCMCVCGTFRQTIHVTLAYVIFYIIYNNNSRTPPANFFFLSI